MSRDSSDTEGPLHCYSTYADIIANKTVALEHGDDLRRLSKRAFNAGDMQLVEKCKELRRSASVVQQAQQGAEVVTRAFSTESSWRRLTLENPTPFPVMPSRSTLPRNNTSEATIVIDPTQRTSSFAGRKLPNTPVLAVLPRLPGIAPFTSPLVAPHRVHPPPPVPRCAPAVASTNSRDRATIGLHQPRRKRSTSRALPVPPSPKNRYSSASAALASVFGKTEELHAAPDEGRVSQPDGDAGDEGEVYLWDEDVVAEEVPVEEGQHHVPRNSSHVFTTRISDLESAGLHYQQAMAPLFPSHNLKYSVKGLHVKPDAFAHLQAKPRPLMLFDFGNVTGY